MIDIEADRFDIKEVSVHDTPDKNLNIHLLISLIRRDDIKTDLKNANELQQKIADLW